MRLLANHLVNSTIVSSDEHITIPVHLKQNMKANPRMEIPEDPDKNILAYYSIMRKIPWFSTVDADYYIY